MNKKIKYPEPIQKRLDDCDQRRSALMALEGWPAPDYESGLQLMFFLMGGWPAWKKLHPSAPPSLPETEYGAECVCPDFFGSHADCSFPKCNYRYKEHAKVPSPDQPASEREEKFIYIPFEGGVAKVSPDASPELMDALETMVDLAKKMPDPDQPVPEEVSDELLDIILKGFNGLELPTKLEIGYKGFKYGAIFMYKRDQAIIWKAEADRNNAMAEEERLANLLTTAMHEIKDMRKEYTSLQSRLSSTEAERDAIRKAFDLQAEELKKYRKQ